MRITVAVAALALFLTSLSATAQARAAMSRVPTNIPAQELAPALRALAKDRDFQIVFATKDVASRHTDGAVGELTADETLTQILSGTGLTYHYLDDRTVTILRMDASNPHPARTESTSSAAPGTGNAKGVKQDTSSPFRLAREAEGAAASAPTVEKEHSGAASQTTPMQLEEIVVTAQKRAERLIDTPQSVTVVGSADLNKLQAVQLRDIFSNVAGLTVTTSGVGNSTVSLRGVTSLTPNSTVGIYVDDVPYGSSSAFASGGAFALDAALFDMERIEVLRGPQGTLYGASTMGGLLKYVTNAPDTTDFAGTAQVGASGTDRGGVSYRTNATVNIPLSNNTLALRVSGFESHDGGYINNLGLDQKDADRSNVYGGRIDTVFTPTEALHIRLTGFLQNISRDGSSVVDYSFSGTPLYGSLEQNRRLGEPFQQQFRLGSLTASYNFGPSTLTSITSYQSVNTTERPDESALASLLNPPGQNLYAAAGIQAGDSTKKLTQEIRVTSDSGQTFEYLIGAFYTHETSAQTQTLVLQSPAGQIVANNLYALDTPSIYQEYALFADLTYHLTSRFDIAAGIRQAHDRQSYSEVETGAFGTANVASEADESVRTYLANARYHITDDATAYIRYATGYRPGGPNFVSTSPVTGQPLGPSTFGADNLKSYEGGIKASTDGGLVSVDLAAYYIDWKNIQITSFVGNFGIIENAPNAHIQGAELSLNAQPLRGLTLSGSFAYQHAYLSQASVPLGAQGGDRLPNVPRLSGSLNADYTILAQQWRPTFGATVRRTTGRNTAFGPTGTGTDFFLPGYTTLDLRSGAVVGSVTLQLYAHNVCNKRGAISGGAYGTYEQVSIIEPLTVGVSALVHF